ncbi:MAG TPA: DUF424 family protein [Desulfurococcales archaeon]|nr:DUF424 family protein [Desulfurococcales archaeon]
MVKKVYLKKYESGGEILVAVCDENLLGKRFTEGKLVLDVKKEFYGGTLVTIDEAIRELKKATIANIVGENIVREALKEGLIHEEAILWVSNIPHAQIVKIKYPFI